MLSYRTQNEIKRQVDMHFGDQGHGDHLYRAALTLADAGWSWEAMRDILSDAYKAGWDQGYRDGQ